jgi:putative hydrolase of HD superfamily
VAAPFVYLFILSALLIPQAGYAADPFCTFLLSSTPPGNELLALVQNSLDQKPRSGWIARGIPEASAETVLAHSKKVRQAVIALQKSRRGGLDYSKLQEMALIHDLAEFKAPDFMPSSGVSAAEKFQIENAVFRDLTNTDPRFERVWALWLEFEEQLSPEARILKDLDKLDAAIQALVYDSQGFHRVRDFYTYTLEQVKDSQLKAVFTLMLQKNCPSDQIYNLYFSLLEHLGHCGEGPC